MKRLVVVAAAATVLMAMLAASSASAFSLGTTTTCTFFPHINGDAEPNVFNGAITICSVVTYTLVEETTTGCLYSGQETDYVFLGNAGAGPVVARGSGPLFVYRIYGAFRPDAPLRTFEDGSPNPYVSPTFTFENPCQS
ncbi:MAG: hypothetical protein QOH23_2464 [Gaiellaceae bacterium]|jgi:hypothetical protein|nr:hypothetical protein [Gaiellaceae bacterium]